MVLPPSDQVVVAGDLGLELGDAVAVSEEVPDAEKRLQCQDTSVSDGGPPRGSR